MNKLSIEVRTKAKEYMGSGCLLKVIKRKPWLECIGNFNPMFCRYKGRRTLVHSQEGDLSDPFRREESYLKSLYIEV